MSQDRVSLRRLLCASLVAAALASLASADDAFRGAAEIRLGESVHAAFPDPAGGPHRYTLYATAGSTITAVVRADAGRAPGLRLTHPGGLAVDLGRALRSTGRVARIDRFAVPYAGLYVLEVSPRGPGGYTLTTSGRVGRGLLGLYPESPAGDAGWEFDAPAGVRMSVRVAPRRAGPSIEITGLETPSGDTTAVLSLQRGAAAEVRDVALTETGRFRLTWTNRGAAGDLRLTFRFERQPGVPPVRELGVSDGVATGAIERGSSAAPARDGYVGSAVCGRCHDELVQSWSGTAHNSAVRSWDRAGLAGVAMTNDADFKAGLDLAATPAFAAYGAAAPKLLHVAGAATPYQVRIGATTYVVERTMGGNGLWVQRFLARVGAQLQPLPFEFDERTKTYAAYRAEDWYDPALAPRAAPSKDRSYEAQCSGCHETGATLASDGAGGFKTGSVELNIGCEQCHGPGAAHAKHGDVRKILNPRRLLADTTPLADGTFQGVARANDVCARCHTKGESTGTLPGSSASAEFPFVAGQMAQAGDKVRDFLRPTNDAADLWGKKTNPLPTLPGDTSVATRGDRPHGEDIAHGEHGPFSDHAAACFDCHDPHRRKNEHQVATQVNRGVRVATRADDNSLCLSCHAGGDFFEGVTAADAAAIHGSASPPAAVARAVIDHMKDIGMPVRDGFYDPAGTGVGRCTTCHMPQTPTVGSTTTDKAGFAVGDLHSHRFEIVWPSASVKHGVTNSCNACHSTGPQDKVGPILTQWASPAVGQTAFHGASPPTSQDGVALNQAANPTRGGGVKCISCHTAEGFARLTVNGEALPQEEIDVIAKESVAQDRGISCDACHGRRADGQFHGEDANPLRLPKDELCATCHNAETVTFTDFRDHGAVVRHPQREMLAGTAGDAPPGAPATATTAHSGFPDGCVTCHYDSDHAVGKHDFRPDVATCTDCHKGLATFDRPAKADYDGDGVVRGIQTETSGLLDRLKAALLLDSRMTFAAGRFDFAGAADHALTGASEAQKRAVFNWYSVEDDRSRGVHNAARTVQLLQKSYRELTGADVPGATLR